MDPVGSLQAALLVCVTVCAAATDLWKGRIYNAVTYPAIALGFALQIITHGPTGFWSALSGFAVGFAPALVLFALGGLGGGDVKLMGAIGAIVGAIPTTETLLLSFVFGGVVGLAKLAWRGTLFRTLGRTCWSMARVVIPRLPSPAPSERLEMRFGAVICVAALAMLFDLRLGTLSNLLK